MKAEARVERFVVRIEPVPCHVLCMERQLLIQPLSNLRVDLDRLRFSITLPDRDFFAINISRYSFQSYVVEKLRFYVNRAGVYNGFFQSPYAYKIRSSVVNIECDCYIVQVLICVSGLVLRQRRNRVLPVLCKVLRLDLVFVGVPAPLSDCCGRFRILHPSKSRRLA